MRPRSLRALHIVVDAEPPVFNDAIAIELLPRYLRGFIDRQQTIPGWRRRLRPVDPAGTAMRSQIVVRARYAEDLPGRIAGKRAHHDM